MNMKKMKEKLFVILLLACLFCNAQPYQAVVGNVKVIKVEMAAEPVRVRVGHKVQLKTGLRGEKLKWSSADKETVMVNQKGEVRGLRSGSTVIEVTNGKKIKGWRVKVTPQVIVIDAGHQSRANLSKEPIGPGASQKKIKVSGGAAGVVTHQAEYKLNLVVAKKLEKALKEEGYRVVMIRTTNDVNIPNSERAKIANEAEADAFIRIHANSSTSSSVSGALTISPTAKNPYCSSIYKDSYALSKSVIDHVVKETGCKNRGVWKTDTMSGINWCKVPVTILEMGYLSNPAEDRLLADEKYQDKIVQGTVAGIKEYLNQ